MDSGQANLTHVAVGSNGAIYAAGWTGVFASGSMDWLLARYSIAGKRAWVRTYDGGAHSNDMLRDMYVSGDACVVVGSAATSSSLTAKGGWFGRVTQMSIWARRQGESCRRARELLVRPCSRGPGRAGDSVVVHQDQLVDPRRAGQGAWPTTAQDASHTAMLRAT